MTLDLTMLVADVQVSGVCRRVHYRKGTADEQVFAQIWGALDYDLSTLPAHLTKRIAAHYAAIDQPTIVDGGAHIGLAAVWFALSFPKAKVIAIEPQADNFALLKLNTQGLRVQPVRAALGERHGLVDIIDVGEGTWAYQTVPSGPGAGGLMAFPITEFIEPDRIFVVKLDIEGAEAAVLRYPAWVERVPVVIMEHHGWVDRSVLQSLYAEGREVHQVGENVCSVLL